MSNEKSDEYVVDTAKMRCSNGTLEPELIVPKDRSCNLRDKKAANASDVTPDCNLIFGSCIVGGNCYSAKKELWQDTKLDFIIDDYPAVLRKRSWTRCQVGGLIKFVSSGQDIGDELKDEQEWEEIGNNKGE